MGGETIDHNVLSLKKTLLQMDNKSLVFSLHLYSFAIRGNVALTFYSSYTNEDIFLKKQTETNYFEWDARRRVD